MAQRATGIGKWSAMSKAERRAHATRVVFETRSNGVVRLELASLLALYRAMDRCHSELSGCLIRLFCPQGEAMATISWSLTFEDLEDLDIAP